MAVDALVRRHESLAFPDYFKILAALLLAHDKQFDRVQLLGVKLPGEYFAAFGFPGKTNRPLDNYQGRIIDQGIALREIAHTDRIDVHPLLCHQTPELILAQFTGW